MFRLGRNAVANLRMWLEYTHVNIRGRLMWKVRVSIDRTSGLWVVDRSRRGANATLRRILRSFLVLQRGAAGRFAADGVAGEGEPAKLAEQSRAGSNLGNFAGMHSARPIVRNENSTGRRHVGVWKRSRGGKNGRGSELIEILIAGMCRPRAQHPYVNRERRLASSFNDE